MLGVPPTATDVEIRTAYKELAKTTHPDRLGIAPESSVWKRANARLAEVNEAFSVLSDPVKRKEYDAERAARNTDSHGTRPSAPERAFLIATGSVIRDLSTLLRTLLADRVITSYYSCLAHCAFCTSDHTAHEIAKSIERRVGAVAGTRFLVIGVTDEMQGRLPKRAWEFLRERVTSTSGNRR